MGKKNKGNQQPKVEETVVEETVVEETVVEETVQITSTEIRIVSNENLNFRNFKIKKNEEIIISDEAFNKLCEEIPNLELMRSKGIIQLVK